MDTPELLALPRCKGSDLLKVWCVYCDKWHVHGMGYGHRVAHCESDASPYRETGYILVPLGD